MCYGGCGVTLAEFWLLISTLVIVTHAVCDVVCRCFYGVVLINIMYIIYFPQYYLCQIFALYKHICTYIQNNISKNLNLIL